MANFASPAHLSLVATRHIGTIGLIIKSLDLTIGSFQKNLHLKFVLKKLVMVALRYVRKHREEGVMPFTAVSALLLILAPFKLTQVLCCLCQGDSGQAGKRLISVDCDNRKRSNSQLV